MLERPADSNRDIGLVDQWALRALCGFTGFNVSHAEAGTAPCSASNARPLPLWLRVECTAWVIHDVAKLGAKRRAFGGAPGERRREA